MIQSLIENDFHFQYKKEITICQGFFVKFSLQDILNFFIKTPEKVVHDDRS